MPTVPNTPESPESPPELGSWQFSWVHTAAPLVAIRGFGTFWHWANARHEYADYDASKHARVMELADPGIPRSYVIRIPLGAYDGRSVTVNVIDAETGVAIGAGDVGALGATWNPPT